LKIKLIIALSCFISALNAGTFSAKALKALNKPYELIFGSQDASESYQRAARIALADYGVTNPELVAIKQINPKASTLIDKDLLSFTLFGIWLNEQALNEIDPAIKEWAIYHEVAHHVLNHHAKALALTSLLGLLIAQQFCYTPFDNKAINALCTGLVGYFSYETLKSYVRVQELQADIEATRILCLIGKKETVESYLKLLKEEMVAGSPSDEWHYSFADQYSTINYYYQLYK